MTTRNPDDKLTFPGQVDPAYLDPVNHPLHYTSHPSGVECIEITEHFNFCLGNAIKYIWRADKKGSDMEDLKKARWYLEREIRRREKMEGETIRVSGVPYPVDQDALQKMREAENPDLTDEY